MTAATEPMPPIPSRLDTMQRHREAGGRVAAVFPVHYPRALFRAFGMLPVEVWGPPGIETGPGDAHLQAYTCSVVRSGLAFLEGGGLDSVDVLVVPHACDSMQGLGSVLLDYLQPRATVLPFYVPRSEGEAGVAYLAAEYGRLYERLAEVTGDRPSDEALREAVRVDETADAALARLLEYRETLPLSDRQLYRLARSREFLPAERFTELVEQALSGRTDTPRPGVPVVLSGTVPEPMEVLDAIADAGGRVVADDLMCTGRRVYPPGVSEKPLRRMAERLLAAPPDSTRGSITAHRIRHLRALVRDHGARAVVFYPVKFCEVELFYLPQLREALERDGLHTVTVEVDLHDGLSNQAITRLEALLETAA